MGIKTYQEKNTKPMEKELAQSDLPVRRKIQKNTRKCDFYEKPFQIMLTPYLEILNSPARWGVRHRDCHRGRWHMGRTQMSLSSCGRSEKEEQWSRSWSSPVFNIMLLINAMIIMIINIIISIVTFSSLVSCTFQNSQLIKDGCSASCTSLGVRPGYLKILLIWFLF